MIGIDKKIGKITINGELFFSTYDGLIGYTKELSKYLEDKTYNRRIDDE